MKSVVVTPEQFEEAVYKALAEYNDEVLKTTDQCAKNAARQTSSEIKSTSPVKTGQYARGWSRRSIKDGAWGTRQVVYNRTDYQLIHLLEKPHGTGGGGHYPKNVDYTGTIERIEDKYMDKFMEEVISKL